MKAYNLPLDYVLYKMSYINMIMYSAVLPSITGGRKKAEEHQDIIKAGDPRNRDRVRKFLDNIE